jgi:protein fantom
VTIVVASLTLDEESPLLRNPEVKQLFVEYHFQGVPPEETETPFSLPKPAADMPIAYNFSKSKRTGYSL